jgi:TonB family protein
LRHDSLLNLVQRLIEAFLFFNPWVRLASSSLCAEREAACDDWVVAKTGRSDEYAACLATIAQSACARSMPLLTPSVLGSRHALVARIERLGSNEPRSLSVNAFAVGGTVMLFVAITLAFQAFSPALAAGAAPSSGGAANVPAVLAAACTKPDSDALVVNPVMPAIPHGSKVSASVEIAVTIAPSGQVTQAKVARSSGNPTIDAAVLKAAQKSTYSPKIVNCRAVTGGYLFRANLAPGP